MSRNILFFYEFFAVMLPVGFISVFCKTENLKRSEVLIRGLLIFIFASYIFAVFYLTGVCTLYDASIANLNFYSGKINLLPFSQTTPRTLILNILLFVPLGFLLPLLWNDYRKLGRALLAGFSLSLFIEMLQLFNLRCTDVDDLIMNTLGTVLGYIMFAAFRKIAGGKISESKKFKPKASLYILIMFLGRFLLFNEVGFAQIFH